MDNKKDNVPVCHAPEEKVIPERNRMGLVQALTILHKLRDICAGESDLVDALDTVFVWIDEMVLLLNKFGKRMD